MGKTIGCYRGRPRSEDTDLRGSDRWPAGSDSPHPEVKASPWASAKTGPGGAGCPRTQSSERPPPRSGTHPAQKCQTNLFIPILLLLFPIIR